MNSLPSGVKQESSRDGEVMQDVFSGFAGALGTAVLLIYAVLVLFANFLHPVTIMATLPLSLGGALPFGKPMYEATLDSGVARLRPILMTTIAMIAGMVPIALGIGAVGKLAARWRWR
jgi:multidrug efflux pump subunit AcrB